MIEADPLPETVSPPLAVSISIVTRSTSLARCSTLSRYIRFVSTRTVGFVIDTAYAEQIGIGVGTFYTPYSVAEYAVMMMMMSLLHEDHDHPQPGAFTPSCIRGRRCMTSRWALGARVKLVGLWRRFSLALAVKFA